MYFILLGSSTRNVNPFRAAVVYDDVKDTNLTPRQWVWVRSKYFQNWFGRCLKLSEQEQIKSLNLQTLQNIYYGYKNGNRKSERLSEKEQQGLVEGRQSLVEASKILGADRGLQAGRRVASERPIKDIQQETLEEYAKKKTYGESVAIVEQNRVRPYKNSPLTFEEVKKDIQDKGYEAVNQSKSQPLVLWHRVVLLCYACSIVLLCQQK
ncbi:MAG: hypothetical protein KF882_00850 [Bacteroidia bacterium]|nr:hypothetical protein [Bacteroidia bacterium]MCO5252942.1 hypothetical protein [Bacteroidota bacterium]